MGLKAHDRVMTTIYLFIMMAGEFSPSRAIVVAAHRGQAAGLRKVINDGN